MNTKFKLLGLAILLTGCETVSSPVTNTTPAATYSNQYLLMQRGLDYRFSDYHSFDMADVYQCQRSCNSDGHCQAYTWTVPGYQSSVGKCWLKNWGADAKPTPATLDCPECISGLSTHFASRGTSTNGQIGVPRVVSGQTQRQQTQIEQRTTDEVNRRVDGAVNRVLDSIFGK